MADLMTKDIEKLSEEDYSYFLAHGDLEEVKEMTDLEYENYIKSHRMYDLWLKTSP